MTNSMLFPSNIAGSRQQSQWIASDVEPYTVEWTEKLRDGTTVLIRPIGDEDVELERRFIEELAPESRRFRFLGEIKSPSAELLQQFTHPGQSEAAFVALLGEGPARKEIGVSRFSARNDRLNCECAVAVSDEWHDKGLATLLMGHLIAVARQRGIECMYSVDAVDNHAMRELAKHLGFQCKPDPNDATQVIHTLDLRAPTV
jgi:GNAT superfamily N-acetyltransferase